MAHMSHRSVWKRHVDARSPFVVRRDLERVLAPSVELFETSPGVAEPDSDMAVERPAEGQARAVVANAEMQALAAAPRREFDCSSCRQLRGPVADGVLDERLHQESGHGG